MAIAAFGCIDIFRKASPYGVYVLFLLLGAYLLNQLDRYTLAIVSKSIAQEIGYGDKACMANGTFGNITDKFCANATSEDDCHMMMNAGEQVCKYDYNGQGIQYQIIAGPVFILIYTFSGIFIGIAADFYSRKKLLAFCLAFWSIMTLLTGFVNEYWELVLLRFGLGFGEAGCTPFASSLIADYFDVELRGAALGVYNWGIYMGYSMSYALGNLITKANILGMGWRWVFFIAGMPGILLGLVIFFTVREPERAKGVQSAGPKSAAQEEEEAAAQLAEDSITRTQRLLNIIRPFYRPTLWMLCIAGSIRNAAGYVWGYNTQPYFQSIGQTPEQIATYMSWIPLVGGSFGAAFGGFISDRVVKKQGLSARIWVLIISQLVAAPFAAGALFLPTPWAYISLIPANIIGEMWVGVCLTVVIELVPTKVRTGAVAFYLFIISNIGGNMQLILPPIQNSFKSYGYDSIDSLRAALYILYPGEFALGSVLFFVTLVVYKIEKKAKKDDDAYQVLVND